METIFLRISLNFKFALNENTFMSKTRQMCLSSDLSCVKLERYFLMQQLLTEWAGVTDSMLTQA